MVFYKLKKLNLIFKKKNIKKNIKYFKNIFVF